MRIDEVKTYEEYIIHRMEELEAKERELEALNKNINLLKELGVIRMTRKIESDIPTCSIAIQGGSFKECEDPKVADEDSIQDMQIYRALMFVFYNRIIWNCRNGR